MNICEWCICLVKAIVGVWCNDCHKLIGIHFLLVNYEIETLFIILSCCCGDNDIDIVELLHAKCW